MVRNYHKSRHNELKGVLHIYLIITYDDSPILLTTSLPVNQNRLEHLQGLAHCTEPGISSVGGVLITESKFSRPFLSAGGQCLTGQMGTSIDLVECA